MLALAFELLLVVLASTAFGDELKGATTVVVLVPAEAPRSTRHPGASQLLPEGREVLGPAPVAMSLHEAQHRARKMLAAGHSNVEVVLAAGMHILDRPLKLGTADSGVVWRGVPGSVVSGGKLLGGWTVSDDGTWTAALPTGVEITRTLWVNGERRNRTALHGADCCNVHPKNAIFELDGETVALTNITDKGYIGNSSRFMQLENAMDIELLYTRVGSSWTEGRCTLDSIVPHASGAELVVKQPCFANQRNKSYNQAVSYPRSLEQISLRSALSPGEWYLDRAGGQVVFKPTAADLAVGLSTSIGSVLAAVGTDAASTALLDLDGVKGLSFETVHFDQGGGWGGASNNLGYTETQAAYHASAGYAPGKFPGYNDSAWVAVPAAINVHGGSTGVTFTGCTFTRMGASAVMFSGGSSHGSIINSTFTDLSGSAVMLGQVDDWGETVESRQNHGFLLAHNTIARTSLEYRGSPGITAGYVRDTVIEHNEISHLSYSGVSIGWGWGREDSYARNNTVRFNHIHHHMCGPLYDGGSVYTLGPQGSVDNPSTVHDNYFHDQCNLFGCLYHDGGTGFFHSYRNVIDKCEKKMFILINGNPKQSNMQEPPHFTYQGSIKVESTFVGPPNKAGDEPRVQCPPYKNQANPNCTVTGTVFMASSEMSTWPTAAQAIVKAAGPHGSRG